MKRCFRSTIISFVTGSLATGVGLTCLFVWNAAAQQQSSQGVLAFPSKQIAIPSSFDRRYTFPSISNGYLVSFWREGEKPEIYLYSLASGGRAEVSLSLPGATNIVMEDAAVNDDGNILVAGSYTTKSRSAPINFISELDLGGRVHSIVDLGDYTPSRICTASDGTFWTLGQSWQREMAVTRSDYLMLRNYAANGTVKHAYLSRNSLAQGAVNLHPRGRKYGRAVTQAFLTCGQESVGALIGNYGTQRWLEVSLQTGIARDWSVQAAPGKSAIVGLGLLTANTVYASIRSEDASATKREQYRLVFKPDGTAYWRLTRKNTANVRYGRLVGTDHSSLVVLRYTGVDQPALFWNRP